MFSKPYTSIIYIFLALVLLSCNPTQQEVRLWIGTSTNESSKGIYSIIFDQTAGTFGTPELAYEIENPAYLSLIQNQLFAVSESEQGSIVSFSRKENGLTLLNSVTSGGKGACYVGVSNDRSMVAVANYGSGNGVVHGVSESGKIGEFLFFYQHSGSGTNRNRQEAPHAHCSIFSPDNQWLYVVDLGTDQVMGYPTTGSQMGQPFLALQLEGGDGPRHLIFHPEKQMAFLINELSNTIMSLSLTSDGTFTVIDKQMTIPRDFTEHSQCADIHISSDGRFLYGSNRGHNSIVTFRVSDEGTLGLAGFASVEGDWPRNFTLSPNEKFLLVGNRRTNEITVFSRNTETGLLTFNGSRLQVSQPTCLKFEGVD